MCLCIQVVFNITAKCEFCLLNQFQTDLEITGNLDISLKYELPSTLNVTINRGQHLTNHYQGHLPNPFVKVQIPGVAAVFETEVRKSKVFFINLENQSLTHV